MVVLGGSFFALGNVNPAAEANVGDFSPDGVYKYYNIHNAFYSSFFKPVDMLF